MVSSSSKRPKADGCPKLCGVSAGDSSNKEQKLPPSERKKRPLRWVLGKRSIINRPSKAYPGRCQELSGVFVRDSSNKDKKLLTSE